MATTSQGWAAGLTVFRDPSSVAVVGASADPAKWGYWLAAGALAGAHRRRVDLVSRRGGAVRGRPCVTGLSALREVPELVALCVPAAHVPDLVAEGLALGVRGFLGITSGVPDEGPLAARIRAAGARLVGANSLGIVDTATDLHLAWGRFTSGPLAVISQSGQLGSELAILGARHGLGVSRFVSVGNASDVTATELLADLAEHDATKVIALYLENFGGGAALFDTLRALRETGKPTLLLTVGASAASSRLARSHTGSLTSSLDAVDAACRAAGVARVGTPGELIDMARALLATRPPQGRRVAVVGDSGGQGGIAADVADSLGLTVPAFPPELAGSLGAALPAGAATGNPVDLAGAGEQDLTSYATVTETVLRADGVDAAVLTGYFGRYAVDVPGLEDRERRVAERIGAAARETGKPVLVHTMAPDGRTARALWSAGVPAFGHIEAALAALRGLEALGRLAGPAPSTSDISPIEVLPSGYWATRRLLASRGIPFPRAVAARDRDEVASAGRVLRPPYVLKAGWPAHKSELDAVRLGLSTTDELVAAFEAMAARLGSGDYVVEEQDDRSGTVEILVGARRDPDLGPFVVVGAGGTDTEVHRDLAMERAPVSSGTAAWMLGRLRCAALLHGWRGRPPVDVAGLAGLVAAVSHLIAASPRVGELELNPVRVGPDGPVAVDALVIGMDKETDLCN